MAQNLCELGPYNYDDLSPWLQASGMATIATDQRKLKTTLFQVGPPTRFGTKYHDELERAGDVTVFLHANVLEIQTDSTAATVTGVRATSLEGPPFEVAAKIVVLATGGLENVRLLLLSNRVQKAGLGNTFDVVGRYFMDHPWMTGAGFAAFATPLPDLRLYQDETACLGTTIFGTLSGGTVRSRTSARISGAADPVAPAGRGSELTANARSRDRRPARAARGILVPSAAGYRRLRRGDRCDL